MKRGCLFADWKRTKYYKPDTGPHILFGVLRGFAFVMTDWICFCLVGKMGIHNGHSVGPVGGF
jgi:hypothetical protein